MTDLTEYAFDVTLSSAIRVRAKNLEEAREMLSTIDSFSANLGAWPNGDPIPAEVSLDGIGKLFEVGGTSLELEEEKVIGTGSRYWVFENPRHGYRIVRLSDGAEATFSGDDQCETFRNHFSGDETPDDPAENADAADDVGEWADEENEFSTAAERAQSAARFKERFSTLA